MADSLNNVGLALHERLQRSRRIIAKREKEYHKRVRNDSKLPPEKSEEESNAERARLLKKGIDAEDSDTYFDEQRDIEAAESHLCQAVAIYSQLASEDGSGPESTEDLSNALVNLSSFFLYHSRFSEALEFLDHLRRVTEEEKGESLLLAHTYRDISRCLIKTEKYEEGISALKRSLELFEGELGHDDDLATDVRKALDRLVKEGALE